MKKNVIIIVAIVIVTTIATVAIASVVDNKVNVVCWRIYGNIRFNRKYDEPTATAIIEMTLIVLLFLGESLELQSVIFLITIKSPPFLNSCGQTGYVLINRHVLQIILYILINI